MFGELSFTVMNDDLPQPRKQRGRGDALSDGFPTRYLAAKRLGQDCVLLVFVINFPSPEEGRCAISGDTLLTVIWMDIPVLAGCERSR